MITNNPKINVTFEKTTVGLLSQLAKQEHKSLASLVKELALEVREDLYLSKAAENFDKEESKLTVIMKHGNIILNTLSRKSST